MPWVRNWSSSSRRWASISRASSRSARLERNNETNRSRKRRAGPMDGLPLVFEQELVDQAREPAPALGLARQLALAGLGEGVVLGVAVALGLPPGALDPALLLEANERRIQRALV